MANDKLEDMVTVADIVQTQLLTCLPTDTVLLASRKMAEHHFSSILVLENDNVLGIWTEKDALKYDFSKKQSGQALITQVMSSPVKTISSTLSLEEVSSEFRKDGFRHYLVLDEQGKRLGIISQTDVVLKYSLEYYLVPRNVGSVIHAGIPLLDFNTPLTEAIKQMKQHRVDALVVVFADKQYGIITERDIVKAIAEDQDNPQVADYASKGLITINEIESLYQAKLLMLDKKIRHLGVVDNNNALISIINLESILEGMLNSYLEDLRHVVVEQKQALDRSTAHLHLAHKIITSTLEGITITDANGIIQSCNPAFTKITGYSELEVIGKTPAILKSDRQDNDFYKAMWGSIIEHGVWQGEIWNRKKNGDIYAQFLTITSIRDEKSNEITHYAGIFNDITESKANEEKIHKLAFYDPLTRVANRHLFFDRLKQQIAASLRSKHLFALLFIDLDKFKPINDTFGHAAGDFLLQQVSNRLHEIVRDTDTIARMGGDEFVIILTELGVDRVQAEKQSKEIADKIQQHLSLSCSFEGEQFAITASIGISLFSEQSADPEVLLKQADKAMYQAKIEGLNQSRLYR